LRDFTIFGETEKSKLSISGFQVLKTLICHEIAESSLKFSLNF